MADTVPEEVFSITAMEEETLGESVQFIAGKYAGKKGWLDNSSGEKKAVPLLSLLLLTWAKLVKSKPLYTGILMKRSQSTGRLSHMRKQ